MSEGGHQVCESSAVSLPSLYGYYPGRYLIVRCPKTREGRAESLTWSLPSSSGVVVWQPCASWTRWLCYGKACCGLKRVVEGEVYKLCVWRLSWVMRSRAALVVRNDLCWMCKIHVRNSQGCLTAPSQPATFRRKSSIRARTIIESPFSSTLTSCQSSLTSEPIAQVVH